MVLINSTKRPTKTLKKLARFVAERSVSTNLTIIEVAPVKDSLVVGWADKFSLLAYLKYGTPSRVQIGMACDYNYPQESCYRKSVGAVEYRNWQEEFLFVLAHEMRHIDQFWTEKIPRYYEVDAEKHAVKVLTAWRDSV